MGDGMGEFIELKNDSLQVTIAKPGTVYRGSRFDWTGFITQVTLEGIHTFCTRQEMNRIDDDLGIGLCNEFGSDGYDEINCGELFPKIGVGLLTKKTDDRYFAGDSYEIEPFSIKMKTELNAVRFCVMAKECNGYAIQLNKTIRLVDQSIIIDYQLHNVGKKRIETNEYTHNFISIDHEPAGPSYRLTFPYDLEGFYATSPLDIQGNRIYFKEKPKEAFHCKMLGFTGPFQWELEHLPTGVGLREMVSEATSRIQLWGKPHVICVEAFVDIKLSPGSFKQWTRIYDFFKRRNRQEDHV